MFDWSPALLNLNTGLLVLLTGLTGVLALTQQPFFSEQAKPWLQSALGSEVNNPEYRERNGLAWFVFLSITTILSLGLLEVEELTDATRLNLQLILFLAGLIGILFIVNSLVKHRTIPRLIEFFFSPDVQSFYRDVSAPNRNLFRIVVILGIAEIGIAIAPQAESRIRTNLFDSAELLISFSLLLTLGWLIARLFNLFFDQYLLGVPLQGLSNISSEFLLLFKILANGIIALLAIAIFAQTHQINLVGLVASLGIGGIAFAFAAKETLEQLLGGVVLYVDRPFVIGDYIGFWDKRDKIFGRVESIGLRSTKIRNSGKGTLMVVPNSSLTKVNIENFTGAKKVISLLKLTFYRGILEEEKALISNIILESTQGISGIDSHNTEVEFRNFRNELNQEITQAQIAFFILGSGSISLELRRQVLDVANQNIKLQLKSQGIACDCDEPTVYVDSPITI